MKFSSFTVKTFTVNTRILNTMLAALLILPVASPRLHAQEVTAAINGIVTDPSGGLIAGAKVTAKDMDRGTTWPTTTNDAGFYIFPRLPIGNYEVQAESPGFQRAVRSNISLQLNQNARVDFTMTVGDVNQTIEVIGVAPALQTQSTQLGTVIDSRTNTQ